MVVIGPWKRALVLSAAACAAWPAALPAQESPWSLLSPWTLNRSGYFLQSTASFLSTGRVYDGIGEKTELPPGVHYRDITTNLHLEYGIRDRIGLLLALPVRSLRLEREAPPDLKTTGIGDVTGGVRYRLMDGSTAVSAQAEIKLSSGYNAVLQNPPLGQGQTDYTARLLAGKGIESSHVFGQVSGGFRYRTGAPANQILANLDVGGWAGKRALLGGHWEFVKHKGDQVPYDHFQGGVTARYRVKKAWNAAGGVFHIFGGQNTPAGTRFFLGVNWIGNRLASSNGFLAAAAPGQAVAPAPKPAPAVQKEEPKPAPPPAEETPTPPDTSGTTPAPPSPPKG